MCQLATISTALFAANLFTVRPAVPTPGLLAVDARRVEVIPRSARFSGFFEIRSGPLFGISSWQGDPSAGTVKQVLRSMSQFTSDQLLAFLAVGNVASHIQGARRVQSVVITETKPWVRHSSNDIKQMTGAARCARTAAKLMDF